MNKSVSKVKLGEYDATKAKEDIKNCTITREERTRIGKELSNSSITLKEHFRGFEANSSYRQDISSGLATNQSNRPTLEIMNAERNANKLKHRLGMIKLGHDSTDYNPRTESSD